MPYKVKEEMTRAHVLILCKGAERIETIINNAIDKMLPPGVCQQFSKFAKDAREWRERATKALESGTIEELEAMEKDNIVAKTEKALDEIVKN